MNKCMRSLRHPLITGSKMELSAKTVLTIFFAAAYLFLLSVGRIRERYAAYYAAYLGAGIELLILAVLCRRSWWPMWKCIPFFQYAACCTVHFAIIVSRTEVFRRESLILLYALLQNGLILRAAFGLGCALRQDEARQQYVRLFAFRSPLFFFTGLDLMVSTASMIINPAEYHIAIEFLARFSFSAANVLLAIPDGTLLFNVKRFARIVLMLMIVAVMGAVGFQLLSFISGEQLPLSWLLIGSAGLSVDVLAVGSFLRSHCLEKKHRRWLRYQNMFFNERDPAVEEREREYILDEALKYDYSLEYASRMWNTSFYRSDIASIQNRLTEIMQERSVLRGCNGAPSTVRLQEIEAEAVNLLGKLSIIHRFTTGFDSCPADMLVEGDTSNTT